MSHCKQLLRVRLGEQGGVCGLLPFSRELNAAGGNGAHGVSSAAIRAARWQLLFFLLQRTLGRKRVQKHGGSFKDRECRVPSSQGLPSVLSLCVPPFPIPLLHVCHCIPACWGGRSRTCSWNAPGSVCSEQTLLGTCKLLLGRCRAKSVPAGRGGLQEAVLTLHLSPRRATAVPGNP